MKSINEYVQAAHENAKSKGWWNGERSFGEIIALIHSEASEALEDYRNGLAMTEMVYEYKNGLGVPGVYDSVLKEDLLNNWHYLEKDFKPCGIPSELADIVIRVFDACGRYGIDLEQAIREKMAYNATRPQRHGGKKL
ncbi:hypothetical protein [Paenibacillus dokdonensis]